MVEWSTAFSELKYLKKTTGCIAMNITAITIPKTVSPNLCVPLTKRIILICPILWKKTKYLLSLLKVITFHTFHIFNIFTL